MKRFYLSYDHGRISNWINICHGSLLLRIKLPYYFLILIRSDVKKWKSSWKSSICQIGERIYKNVIGLCHQNISASEEKESTQFQALASNIKNGLPSMKDLTLPLLLPSPAIAQRPMACSEQYIPGYRIRGMLGNRSIVF